MMRPKPLAADILTKKSGSAGENKISFVPPAFFATPHPYRRHRRLSYSLNPVT
jgi:hypothetical protein